MHRTADYDCIAGINEWLVKSVMFSRERAYYYYHQKDQQYINFKLKDVPHKAIHYFNFLKALDTEPA